MDTRPSLERLYLSAYDRLFRRPGWALVLATAAAAGSAWLVPRVSLDMSFRPLFGQDRAALDATRDFEERFGQRSGAHIGAIITPHEWTPALVESISAATTAVDELDHVVEVLSLARIPQRGADWEGTTIPQPGGLDSVSDVEMRPLLEAREFGALERTIFSPDGRRTVLLARLDLPLEDLDRRARVIRAFETAVTERVGPHAELDWVGISVVEVAYARLVLSGIALSLVLTTTTLLIALGLVFRRPGAVVVILSGVTLALPVAVAVMVVRDQAITIVNSMVPTMIMIIGVADAIHMFECYAARVRSGERSSTAVRSMFGEMALPCLLTALTTIAGFVALETAEIAAIRDFGINVAVGVGVVYAFNLLSLPALLLVLPDSWLLDTSARGSWLDSWKGATARLVTRRAGTVVVGSAATILVCAAGISRLDVNQRFNEEVAEDHPVRASQSLFEREFTGLLGPDITVRRTDGELVTHRSDRERLTRFVAALESLPGVIHVWSMLDLIPPDATDSAAFALTGLRDDEHIGPRVRDVLDEAGTQAAVAVGVADIGSHAALPLVDEIRRVAARQLGSEYEVEVVGQWWLAQLGLSNILRDMLVSFATSFVLVLPLMALALGSVRLFLYGVVPNLLPMLVALGFMGWAGISARVGTAMILAIALAIAVDDTIHILVRLKKTRKDGLGPEAQVRSTIEHTGGAVLLTTVVLVGGFLSMRANGLLALQDMGLVAAATLTLAFLADVYLLPASYLWIERALAPETNAPATDAPRSPRTAASPIYAAEIPPLRSPTYASARSWKPPFQCAPQLTSHSIKEGDEGS